jgi:hypothetical protein
MNEYKNFILQKHNDITNCVFEVENVIQSSDVDWGQYRLNKPTGEKEVNICVLFGPPCPEDKQNDIVNCIDEFVGDLQKGLACKEVDIYEFKTTFDIDALAQITLGYKWMVTDQGRESL